MYESFFGLECEPFSVAADPRFIYLSPKHRQARAHLRHGLKRGAGFLLLTGEIGAGKTTVCRLFLQQLPSNVDVAFVVNPRLDARALLTRVCEDLRIDLPPGAIDLIDLIHGHLLLAHAQGRRTLIVVDEAQALSHDVMEQLRLLTNLDATGSKLQVFLIGQPELRTILRHPALEPLAQRVIARFHLAALGEAETGPYIAHRLSVAGYAGPLPFSDGAVMAIHRLTRGVPRRVNVLCDQALLAAQSSGTRLVDQAMIDRVAIDALDLQQAPPAEPGTPQVAASEAPPPEGSPTNWRAMAAVAAAALLIGGYLGRGYLRSEPPTAAQPNPQVSTPARSTAPNADSPPPSAASPPQSPPPRAVAATSSSTATPAAASLALVGSTAARAQIAAPPPGTPLPPVRTADFDRPSAPQAVHVVNVIEAAVPTEPAAWRNLARIWGATLGAGEPCAAATEAGVRCFRTTGGLGVIRQLGRPGILRLIGDDQRVAYALLVGLGGAGATFRAGRTEQTIPLAELAGRWHGDFATLWRWPPDYRVGDPIGADDGLARWMARQFATVDGSSVPDADTGALATRLSAFQLAHGLAPDGLIGPLTIMQLNREAGIDEPRLRLER